MRKDRDILWKGIIEEVFDDLLRFVFPDADELFDLQRKVEFLDKELAELYPEPGRASATREADELVKVYRRDGREEWILIHLEVQNRNEADFPERMFRYYYRVLERWRRQVTALAIFTGSDGHLIPDRYEHSFLGTELRYKYNVLRLCNLDERALSSNPNPFAAVALIGQKEWLTEKLSDGDIIRPKLRMIRELIERFQDKPIVLKAILRFLNNYLILKKRENFPKFIEAFDRELKIKFMTLAEYDVKKEVAIKLIETTDLSDEKISTTLGIRLDIIQELREWLEKK
jgi:hypothetical protein